VAGGGQVGPEMLFEVMFPIPLFHQRSPAIDKQVLSFRAPRELFEFPKGSELRTPLPLQGHGQVKSLQIG
jgi:hypothetical protein